MLRLNYDGLSAKLHQHSLTEFQGGCDSGCQRGQHVKHRGVVLELLLADWKAGEGILSLYFLDHS